VVVDAKEGRRRREDNLVEIRREENLQKKRREALQAQQMPESANSTLVEKKVKKKILVISFVNSSFRFSFCFSN
jgi:hypothetical protein